VEASYSGDTLAASEELFNHIVMQVSLLQKSGQCSGYPKPVLRTKGNLYSIS